VRVIAIFVPHFPIVAHRRRDPDLRRRPTVLVAGARPAVVACSPDAARLGVATGMSQPAAAATCAEAAILPLDMDYCRAEHSRVRETLLTLAPEVEDDALGCWCFLPDGLERLHATEPKLVAATRRAVRAAGYAARIAAAGGRFTAVTVARHGRHETANVPNGREAEALAPVPIEAAPLEPRALHRLRQLGVRTLGDLARLPEDGVRARLGTEGVHAHRLARGLDPAPLAARGAPAVVEAVEDLEPAATLVDELLFRVRVLCDRVIAALADRALACSEVRLELELDGAATVEVPLRLARPTLSPRALWTLLRLRIERLELEGPVMKLRLAIVDAPPARAEQRELFRAYRDSEQLEATVERLRARFGPDAAVSPVAVDVHRPEARLAWRQFEPDDTGRMIGAGAAAPPPGRVLRLVSPPRPFAVAEAARISAPERLSGEWWGDAYARDYHVVLTRAGRMLWVFETSDGWFVQGEFD
jgi:protein ImuB